MTTESRCANFIKAQLAMHNLAISVSNPSSSSDTSAIDQNVEEVFYYLNQIKSSNLTLGTPQKTYLPGNPNPKEPATLDLSKTTDFSDLERTYKSDAIPSFDLVREGTELYILFANQQRMVTLEEVAKNIANGTWRPV